MGSAIGYVRVSSEEQSLHGVSVEAQKEAIRAYATMRGLTLKEIVVDEAVSGAKPLATRQGGGRIASLADKGKVDAVIATKLDRLFRDASDCLATTAKWDKKEVALHLLDVGGMSLDSKSAMGRFFVTLMGAIAELERNMIRDRTRTAMDHKRQRGERIGTVPFGFRVGEDGKSLVPAPVEQEAIRQMVELRSDDWTYEQIAKEISLRGHRTKSGSSEWKAGTVRVILKRQATLCAS